MDLPDGDRHHPPSPKGSTNNAVYKALRSDLWALPALDTGHRLGIQ